MEQLSKGKYMIAYKIKGLIARKELREKRRITLEEVSNEADVNRSALSKMMNPEFQYTTTTKVIEKLCVYFECEISDLIERV